MESLKSAIEQALSAFVERHTGVVPVLKPSKAAHLAASTFLRTDADAAAARLRENAADCTLYGVPLLQDVCAKNGWLLFTFRPDALDRYAERLPQAEEPDDSYFARRLWMYARHPDAPAADDAAVLSGFFAVLFGLPCGERMLLDAPRHKDGTDRIALERRMTRLAKILLYERRYQS